MQSTTFSLPEHDGAEGLAAPPKAGLVPVVLLATLGPVLPSPLLTLKLLPVAEYTRLLTMAEFAAFESHAVMAYRVCDVQAVAAVVISMFFVTRMPYPTLIEPSVQML